jgi:hypothetical protein
MLVMKEKGGEMRREKEIGPWRTRSDVLSEAASRNPETPHDKKPHRTIFNSCAFDPNSMVRIASFERAKTYLAG